MHTPCMCQRHTLLGIQVLQGRAGYVLHVRASAEAGTLLGGAFYLAALLLP